MEVGITRSNRWGRRNRLPVADEFVPAQLSLSMAHESERPALVEVGSQQYEDAGGQKDETHEKKYQKVPTNLQVVLECNLDDIKTGYALCGDSVDDVVDLGSLMAQRGLFPSSKIGQSLMMEHGLSSSFNKVLQGGARHLRGVFGRANDLGLFDALRCELGRGEGAWSRGTKGSARIKWSIPGLNGCGLIDGEIVQDLHGEELPAFSFVLRSLAESVNVEVLSWWVNIYEESSVGLGFHHDHQSNNNGLRWGRLFDMTAGASFGACRELTFRHAATSREFGFPQANGDIFAFDTQTDLDFMHGIYKQKDCCGPRISVIIVGKQRQRLPADASTR